MNLLHGYHTNAHGGFGCDEEKSHQNGKLAQEIYARRCL